MSGRGLSCCTICGKNGVDSVKKPRFHDQAANKRSTLSNLVLQFAEFGCVLRNCNPRQKIQCYARVIRGAHSAAYTSSPTTVDIYVYIKGFAPAREFQSRPEAVYHIQTASYLALELLKLELPGARALATRANWS